MSEISIEGVPEHKLGDVALAHRCMEIICNHYPGYRWRVGLMDEPTGGVLQIFNDDINAQVWSNAPYGYVLHLTTVYDDPDLKCVVRAAGEILERARLTRGRNRGEEITHVDGVAQKHQPITIQ